QGSCTTRPQRRVAATGQPDAVSDTLGPLSGLDELARAVTPVAERFGEAGYRLFLVGGVVRDLMIAQELDQPLAGNDIDLTTEARPEEIKRILAPLADVIWDQGERFGTIGARVGGKAMEITTHRAEAYDPESRKPTVSFGDHITDDLARRDFTINAAAIELPTGSLHDPHGGLVDLRERLLRTPLSPEVSFTDDPLRMLRAARFIPRFDLVPSAELTAAATDLAGRLDIVAVERVADELERLFAVGSPRSGFDFLVEVGLLTHVIPALASVDTAEVEAAVALASAAAAGEHDGPAATVGSVDRLVRRAGLLWPIRAEAGEQLGRLRYSKAETTRTVNLLDAVERGLDEEPSPATVRRLASVAGPDALIAVATLATNLVGVGLAPLAPVADLVRLIEELMRTEDLSDLQGPLSGGEIMELLDLEPGPMVGRALGRQRELRIEQGPLDADAARSALIEWWRQDPSARTSLT
ncbi:MAG: CCA tRNA nucleotidyltransferase, partial [Actinomycetota bacterium]